MYVDAILDKNSNKVLVVERVNNQRVYKEYASQYVLYYEDPNGSYKTLWNNRCKEFRTSNSTEFQAKINLLKKQNIKIHESSVSPVFRCLSENYLNAPTPVLNLGFFDIEVDFDSARGYSTPWDPFNAVTAISVYLTETNQLITLAIKPKTLSHSQAETITNKFDNTILCNDELQMFEDFMEIIENVDVLSTWNGLGYDIPYLINRIKLLTEDTDLEGLENKLCLWDKKPTVKKYIKYKKEQKSYNLIGRIHMDYLDLYMKHSGKELHTYRLDFVGEIEIGENKVPYEGTLDELYNNDFEKFIAYNRQDTLLLHKIDQKKRFIELANQVSHSNTVLLPTTMGTVALVEQSIINKIHQQNMVSLDKPIAEVEIEDEDIEEENSAVGALVLDPKTGLHKQIGCCDINSLYPSTIRALNMGPDTIVGQIRTTATDKFISDRIANGYSSTDSWHSICSVFEFDMVQNQTDDIIVVDFEDGSTKEYRAKELYDLIYKGTDYILSANGTIFDRNKKGIIPSLLETWYSERKIMQATSKIFAKLETGIPVTAELTDLLKSNKKTKVGTIDKINAYIDANFVEQLAYVIEENKIQVVGNKLLLDSKLAKELSVFWDIRQMSKKLLLNSLYGSLLNEKCIFYDKRVGQSTTISGRAIAKHMNSKINEIITGEYDINGEAILYADTDSVDANTKISTSYGVITIEELFEKCSANWISGDKEYSSDEKIKVLGYDPQTNLSNYVNFNYVYRHKVSKKKYKITDSHNNSVVVTEDHSVMVERNGALIETKPISLYTGDTLISLNNTSATVTTIRTTVKSVEQLEDFNDEYVYDIGVNNSTPFFFGNNILVHNSSYFSCVPTWSKDPELKDYVDNKDVIVEYYDQVSEECNSTFPEFMDKTFNTGRENGAIIAAGRELVGSQGLFIKKKRYAIMVYDKEGKRVDTNGSSGTIKAMGLDLKRSDTPKFIQDFLTEVLEDLLRGESKESIFEKITNFRQEFKKLEPWQIGTPKKVNAISDYSSKLATSQELSFANKKTIKQKQKVTVPGHVRASINWNNLKEKNNDKYSTTIQDGHKVIVCKLKPNDYKIDSVAYPYDQQTLPTWFKKLPFDKELMEETILDKKLLNLFGILEWNFGETKNDTTFNEMFSF